MSNKIQFILNDKEVVVDFEKENLSPTTTVLNYLRGRSDCKGTKEGCAEGDCGACSVVLETVSDSSKEYKSVDSCLMFLPMLHGKRLMTVEGIGSSIDMHPVQQAMVHTDGSQCGFCTPGFISSLYVLSKNTENPTREEIDDSLTGNLCRCTGYSPIVEAAETLSNYTPKDEADFSQKIQALNTRGIISIEFDGQEYFKPFTLKDALELKSKYPDALIVNGGTDIGLLVTKRNEKLVQLIDISDVEEINGMSESKSKVTYGAGLSLEKVRMHCEKIFPALFDMLTVFGSKQIRELGTLGGNVANASPIGDTPPVLLSFGASVVLNSVEGKREMKLEDFITGYRTTALKANELITEIVIPVPDEKSIHKSYKISKRKDLDISTVSGGFALVLDKSKVAEIDLFYGGMAAETKHALKAEDFLKGKEWSRENVEHAMTLVDAEFTPISDARAEKEGRTLMARNLLLKFWSETN